MTKSKSVFGVFNTRRDVETAIAELKDAGFANSDISVLLPDKVDKELAAENTTKAPTGVAVGVGSGAAVGGALGWLVGVGALALPGIGPVIAAGPILAALAGVGVGGALGGFGGCLIGVGISEAEVNKYEDRLKKGGILVAIHCETLREMRRAKDIFSRTGTEDISVSDPAEFANLGSPA
jgi:hypothetical protein